MSTSARATSSSPTHSAAARSAASSFWRDITRYSVTKFYDRLIRESGYYEQLKHIVEPSLKEFEEIRRLALDDQDTPAPQTAVTEPVDQAPAADAATEN